MAKIDFDIKYRPQIESGEYKVETRDGRSARIICWDMKSEDGYSILALVNDDGISETTYSFKNTGRYMNSCIDESDLFIVTPEPELAESEDERIRKWIYDLVENLGYPADEDAEKELNEMQPLAIAYLEKQKEKQPIAESKRLANEVIEYLTKCGYSPVLKDDSKKEHFRIDIPRHEDDFWHSEEYKNCYSILGEYYMEGDYGCDTYTLYVWREKKEQQPVAHKNDFVSKHIEWSEDDEFVFESACNALKMHGHHKLSNRLKSLRPQPHWKPSEEQMKALEGVIKCELSAGMHTRAGILQTLQNDLLKNL